ncbi:MAG: hypothetical protein IT285_08605 [Bdellovibrionales bacterium]|nr:hypothetical protein [Bdellovibrionales bacterium]
MPIKDRIKKFDIREEPAPQSDFRVASIDGPKKMEWREFEMPKIQRAGEGDYSSVRRRFGSLAATDSERRERERKDSRFSVNPLLKEPLSIEEEERRAVEERVKARVSEVSAKVREASHAEGYQAGLKQGHDEAYARAATEAKQRIERFDAFLVACEQAKDEIFRANERFVVETVFRVARMVLLREAALDKDLVLRMAKGILERVGVRENIKIAIHPKDREMIDLLRSGLEDAIGKLQNLSIEVSEEVGEGGCTVETQWNAIDASIDTQLGNLHKALLGEGGS